MNQDCIDMINFMKHDHMTFEEYEDAFKIELEALEILSNRFHKQNETKYTYLPGPWQRRNGEYEKTLH